MPVPGAPRNVSVPKFDVAFSASDESVFETPMTPRSPAGKVTVEDPSFRMHTDEESGQTIISGMGELHLDIIVDRLRREFKVESNVGKPEVAYREAITRKAPCEYKYAKQSGGRGQYGHVLMEIEPGRRSPGLRPGPRLAPARARRHSAAPAGSALSCRCPSTRARS